MSLLSKFYHRRYMRKTLEQRARNLENDIDENLDIKRSLLSTDETYESANSGFFASAGEVIDQGNNNNGNFFL